MHRPTSWLDVILFDVTTLLAETQWQHRHQRGAISSITLPKYENVRHIQACRSIQICIIVSVVTVYQCIEVWNEII